MTAVMLMILKNSLFAELFINFEYFEYVWNELPKAGLLTTIKMYQDNYLNEQGIEQHEINAVKWDV